MGWQYPKYEEEYYQKINQTYSSEKEAKITVAYRENPFDDFMLMTVDPPQKLDSEESNIISSYFDI